MLAPDKFKNQVIEWGRGKRWDLVKISSGKRLDAKKIIKFPVGSYFLYIHKEWFEKAKQRKLITENKYGQWVPMVHVDEVSSVIGKRGNNLIFDEKSKRTQIRQTDLDALNQFEDEYHKWQFQQQQIEIELEGVMKTFKEAI